MDETLQSKSQFSVRIFQPNTMSKKPTEKFSFGGDFSVGGGLSGESSNALQVFICSENCNYFMDIRYQEPVLHTVLDCFSRLVHLSRLGSLEERPLLLMRRRKKKRTMRTTKTRMMKATTSPTFPLRFSDV